MEDKVRNKYWSIVTMTKNDNITNSTLDTWNRSVLIKYLGWYMSERLLYFLIV